MTWVLVFLTWSYGVQLGPMTQVRCYERMRTLIETTPREKIAFIGCWNLQ